MTNINEETGVPFGIISGKELHYELVDNLLYLYGTNHTEEEALKEAKHQFLMDKLSVEEFYELDSEDYDEKIEELSDDHDTSFLDHIQVEEPRVSGEHEGVTYSTSWLGGALNFIITHSPHITDKARRGSPCVPNMGVLDTLEGDYECYNVPDGWRGNDE